MTAPYLNRLPISLSAEHRAILMEMAGWAGVPVATMARMLLVEQLEDYRHKQEIDQGMVEAYLSSGRRRDAKDAKPISKRHQAHPKIPGLVDALKAPGAGTGKARRPSHLKAGARRRSKGAK